MITAAVLFCLVVGVNDGDTLTARCGSAANDRQVRVRIAAIDAPERGQPYGKRARQALSALCHRQQAVISSTGKDRYGRLVADVQCQGQDAGMYLVDAGLAWVYDRYAASHWHLYGLQQSAQQAGRGLWANGRAVPPWEWRRPTRKRMGRAP